jgi:hypothetical protein
MATTALVAALVVGCGSSAGDRLTLQFITFQDPQNGQTDSINGTAAEVDIVPDQCTDGSFEPFGETQATAVLMNNGGSDIQLDQVKINTSAAGSAPVTRNITKLLQGGRCSNNASQQCAADADCGGLAGGGTCMHSETDVTFLLFDLQTKLQVSPGTFDIPISFSGVDASDSRFTVQTHLTVTFAHFDNCP